MTTAKPNETPKPLKISALARESGVPVATVKHYLREGLLPEPVKRTGRNMSWYAPSCVERIRTIKRLQQDRFLPLKVIKEVLDRVGDDADDLTMAAAISHFVERSSPYPPRSRAELLALGVSADTLDWLRATDLVTPEGSGDEESYRGDDLAILQLLGKARRVGLAPEMLPTAILAEYARAIRELVRTELEIFRAGVMPLAGARLGELADQATALSEQLVVLVRRKLLLPTLQQLLAGTTAPPKREPKPKAKPAAKPRVSSSRTRRRRQPRNR